MNTQPTHTLEHSTNISGSEPAVLLVPTGLSHKMNNIIRSFGLVGSLTKKLVVGHGSLTGIVLNVASFDGQGREGARGERQLINFCVHMQ